MRTPQIAPNEYYHIYNRGIDHDLTFRDEQDFTRFLFLITHVQSPLDFKKPGRSLPHFLSNGVFETSDQVTAEVVRRRTVGLTCFVLMNNHFHMILHERRESGIATFMNRVQNGYTKYWNTRYKRTGHLFEGPYKAVHIKNNSQLLHLSAYIHKNPKSIRRWFDRELFYPYSSYQDFIKRNRFGSLLSHEIITSQFKSEQDYKNFVEGSTVRKWRQTLGNNHLIA